VGISHKKTHFDKCENDGPDRGVCQGMVIEEGVLVCEIMSYQIMQDIIEMETLSAGGSEFS
jgi:hypothetical protein